MLTERSAPPNEDLKQEIEHEIETDEKEQVSVRVAESLLDVKSIDKAYAELKKRTLESLFKYQPERKNELRPYQRQAIENLDRYLDEKFSTIAVQLPTGAGKTFLIHSYIYERFLSKGKNVLVVTPSWEIAHQHAATMCQGFADGAKRVRRLGGRGQIIDTFQEYRRNERGRVIVTTSALFYARLAKLKESLEVEAIIVDEGHYGWKKKRLNSIQAFAKELQRPTILLTATPPINMEGLPFAAQLRYLDLTPEYLVPCNVVQLDTEEQFDPVIRNGVLSQKSRVELSSRQSRFEKIVGGSIPHIKGQAIYYAGSVREAMGAVHEFAKQGLPAVVVHSKWTSKADKINALAIERFRKGEAHILVNVQMLAMGFDVPNVETVIVARPVESDTLFTQMVGRGARPAPGKNEFILVDVHDVISKPDVAKMFEHKHLFYHDAGAPEALEENEQPIEGSQAPFLPLRDPEPFTFESLHLMRSTQLIEYFMSRQTA